MSPTKKSYALGQLPRKRQCLIRKMEHTLLKSIVTFRGESNALIKTSCKGNRSSVSNNRATKSRPPPLVYAPPRQRRLPCPAYNPIRGAFKKEIFKHSSACFGCRSRNNFPQSHLEKFLATMRTKCMMKHRRTRNWPWQRIEPEWSCKNWTRPRSAPSKPMRTRRAI